MLSENVATNDVLVELTTVVEAIMLLVLLMLELEEVLSSGAF